MGLLKPRLFLAMYKHLNILEVKLIGFAVAGGIQQRNLRSHFVIYFETLNQDIFYNLKKLSRLSVITSTYPFRRYFSIPWNMHQSFFYKSSIRSTLQVVQNNNIVCFKQLCHITFKLRPIMSVKYLCVFKHTIPFI